MATVAGTSTIPMVIGLFVAVALFLAWAAQLVRIQRAESAPPQAAPVPQTAPVRQPTPVQVVIGQHFTVVAPDDAALRAAMSRRVDPPMPFPSPARTTAARTTPAHEEPAAAMPLSRTA